MSGRRRRPGESGQSTVEFALTVLLLMGIVFFYTQLCLMFAWGNYVQYATFMSARALLSSGLTPDEQKDRAVKVLVRTVKKGEGRDGQDRFPSIARGDGGSGPAGASVGPGGQYARGVRDLSWMEGVRYTFRSKLFMIPFAGSKSGPSANSVTLTSESWLGREPSVQECQSFMQPKNWEIDNGC